MDEEIDIVRRRVESFENVWSHLAREVADPLSVLIFYFYFYSFLA
jgi:hypothetical protein